MYFGGNKPSGKTIQGNRANVTGVTKGGDRLNEGVA
jgi:hypothetical protein